MPVTQLNNEQVNRYKRHLILPEVGMEGQLKLVNAKVFCIGAGGLGNPISLYLAAAGVGTIGMADIDVVSPSNLQRQVLFGVSNVGEDKVKAAGKRLKDLNPDVNVIEHKTVVNSSNVLDLLKDYDIIVDGTDNFPTRYCVNDACVILKKPNVYGSIFRFEGMITVFAPHLANPDRAGEHGPCYRCMYPEPPDPGSVPSCAEGGVIGVLPGIIGTLQANEVIKLILGIGRPAIGRLTTFSALDLEFKTFKLRHDRNCPVCGDHPTITEPIDYEQFCGVPALDPEEHRGNAGRSSTHQSAAGHGQRRIRIRRSTQGGLAPPIIRSSPIGKSRRARSSRCSIDTKDFVFIDCRLPNEYAITNIAVAKELYSRCSTHGSLPWRISTRATSRKRSSSTARAAGARCSSRKSCASRGSRTSKAWPGGFCSGTRTSIPAGCSIEPSLLIASPGTPG